MSKSLASVEIAHERITKEVQPYVAGIFPRLAFNFGLLVVLALIVSTIAVPSLAQFIPQSTATTLGFCTNFLLLFFGMRYLENRNHALALFVLYSKYSRERRDLEAFMQQGNQESLESNLDALEELAQSFINAATEAGVQPKA
jgi:uncharacterized membrane protein